MTGGHNSWDKLDLKQVQELGRDTEFHKFGQVRRATRCEGHVHKNLAIPTRRRWKGLADSNAAKAIASRRGIGETRHIEYGYSWLQEVTTSGAKPGGSFEGGKDVVRDGRIDSRSWRTNDSEH